MFCKAKVIILIFIIFCCKNVFSAARFAEYAPKAMPSAMLYDLKGQEFNLEKLEGNVLIIHFWATWCNSCIEELKSLNKLQKLLRKDPVIIIPVSEDFRGADIVKDFYNKFNLKFLPAFLDKNNKWFREMKVSSLPTSFIIDSQGRNVMLMSGKVNWLDERNIALIKKYIAAKQPYNSDYVALMNDHSIIKAKQQNVLKQQNQQHKEGNSGMLSSIETELSLDVIDEKLQQGEISMRNTTTRQDFSKRRPVN